MPTSPAKLEANRANAQLSTGPTSEKGKAQSSLNAVKTGLTGRTVLLSTDDAAVYQEHVARFFKKYEPDTDEERELTQQLAETELRLLRIPTLEAGIYAIGRKELGAQFEHELAEAVSIYTKAREKGEFVDLKALGFVFEMDEVLGRVASNLASRQRAQHEITRTREILAELQAQEAGQKPVAA